MGTAAYYVKVIIAPLAADSDAANLINLVFPDRPLTIPDDARELMGMMVGMGDRTDEILEAWDKALSETE